MFAPKTRQRRSVMVVVLVLILVLVSTSTIFAQDPAFTLEPDPNFTFTHVVPPRNDPAPIPHSDVLDIDMQLETIVRPQSDAAFWTSVLDQNVFGQPGVLPIETPISQGIYLYPGGYICNDFNIEGGWQGETWTSHFGGWGTFAADDGYNQAKNVTFDRERVIGPGNDYNDNSASMKIASNQPYEAGIMSPPIPVEPGDFVVVVAYYLIYNHDDENGFNLDYASLGVIPGPGEMGQYVHGYRRGEWDVMVQYVEATGDSIQIMLQGYSPFALNSNIYFDDVEIWINDYPVSDCRW